MMVSFVRFFIASAAMSLTLAVCMTFAGHVHWTYGLVQVLLSGILLVGLYMCHNFMDHQSRFIAVYRRRLKDAGISVDVEPDVLYDDHTHEEV